jgi:hypothetical protein
MELLSKLREEARRLQGLSSRGIVNYVIMELESMGNPEPSLIREVLHKALAMLSREEEEMVKVRELITRELGRISG